MTSSHDLAAPMFHVKQDPEEAPLLAAPPSGSPAPRHTPQTSVPKGLAHLPEALDGLRREGLLRDRQPALDPTSVSFCSNDYLGLAGVPLTGHTPRGAGASRRSTR